MKEIKRILGTLKTVCDLREIQFLKALSNPSARWLPPEGEGL
jgi:hypothetical protein